MGILGTHSMRFSDVLFLNDGSETTYGVNLVGTVLDELMEGKMDSEKDAAERLKRQVADAVGYFQPIIFCFSARDNLLNQWRDYGKDVVPYAIEFAANELTHEADGTFRISLCKIIYSYSVQRTLLTELLTSIYVKTKTLQGNGFFSEAQATDLLISAAIEIVALITHFKNPAFEAEEEWRAFCYRPDLVGKVSPKFRSSGLGVVPYYEWTAGSGQKQLPVKGVTVGPSPYSAVSDIALRQFLTANRYDVRTNYSVIPIRR